MRHLPEVVAWNRAVFDAVAAALALGHVPLLMGGDHCLAHRLDQRRRPRTAARAARTCA
jgi:arginase family enzyme